jgi:hypothetical protein
MSSLLESDGSLVPQAANKLVITLVGLGRGEISRTGEASATSETTAPAPLDSVVWFAANFSGARYAHGLAILARTVAFLQDLPAFGAEGPPGAERRLNNFALEIVTLNFRDFGSLWGMLGAPYLPSVLCRMRVKNRAGREGHRQSKASWCWI